VRISEEAKMAVAFGGLISIAALIINIMIVVRTFTYGGPKLPGVVAPVVFTLGCVAAFYYVPFVSDYAFWLTALAYIFLAAGFAKQIRTKAQT
jgi:hypothetical protein